MIYTLRRLLIRLDDTNNEKLVKKLQRQLFSLMLKLNNKDEEINTTREDNKGNMILSFGKWRLLVNKKAQIAALEETDGVVVIQTTPIQRNIKELEAIDQSESKTMSDVAQALRITQGTFTVNANRLSKKGYVYRTRDEEDRRVFRLKLTDKAHHVMAVHKKFHENMIETIVSQLSPEEEDLLVDSLSQVNVFFDSLK